MGRGSTIYPQVSLPQTQTLGFKISVAKERISYPHSPVHPVSECLPRAAEGGGAGVGEPIPAAPKWEAAVTAARRGRKERGSQLQLCSAPASGSRFLAAPAPSSYPRTPRSSRPRPARTLAARGRRVSALPGPPGTPSHGPRREGGAGGHAGPGPQGEFVRLPRPGRLLRPAHW